MYRNLASYTKRDPATGKRQTYVWEATWDENGNRVEIETPVNPYFYVEDISTGKDSITNTISISKENDENTNSCVVDQYCAKSMFRTPLTKFTFNTTAERSAALAKIYEIPVYEKLAPTKQYLLDKYCGQEFSHEFAKNPLRIFYIDLEVKIENEFPNPDQAKYPINVISLYDSLTNIMHVWTCHQDDYTLINKEAIEKIKTDVKEYNKDDAEIKVYTFTKEKPMLEDFMYFWTNNYPDVVTGWNIDGFDIPYLIGRLNRIDSKGNSYANFLSPVNGYVYNPISKASNSKDEITSYFINGITILDYIRIYKKFAGTSKQSFKLDYIGKLELDIGKLDYDEIGYESIKEFMNKDFVTFTSYNVIDVFLVRLLDKKLRYISLARTICNIGLCEYENILKSIPYILGALTLQARYKGVKFITDANHKPEPDEREKLNKMTLMERMEYERQKKKEMKKAKEESTYEGAFVVPTEKGYYKNGIFAFDFNSLYPNMMMEINISPETKVGTLVGIEKEQDPFSLPTLTLKTARGHLKELTHDDLVNLVNTKCTLSSNNVLYVKPAIQFGIIPSFLEKMYKERVNVKKKMKESKRKIEVIDKAIAQIEEKLKTM